MGRPSARRQDWINYYSNPENSIRSPSIFSFIDSGLGSSTTTVPSVAGTSDTKTTSDTKYSKNKAAAESDLSWLLKSKVPLARTTLEIQNPPKLYCAEVKIEYETQDEFKYDDEDDFREDPEYQKLHSRRLRLQALQEFVEAYLKGHESHIAISLDPEKKKLANYLFLVQSASGPTDTFPEDLCGNKILLRTTKKEPTKADKARYVTAKKIHCTLEKSETVLSLENPGPNDLYMIGIESLCRQYATGKNCIGASRVDAEVLETPAGIEAPITRDYGFDACIRRRFELKRTADKIKLHIDLDVVPSFRNEQPVTEALENYFASHKMLSGSVDELKTSEIIRQLLCGIRVIYRKTPESSSTGNTDDEKHSTKKADEEDSPTEQLGGKVFHTADATKMYTPPTAASHLTAARVKEAKDSEFEGQEGGLTKKSNTDTHCTIKNIKPATEVARLPAGTGHISIKKYMKVPDNKSICLPLADIGGNKAYWVPLDRLLIARQQPLRRAGHFTYHLKKHFDKKIVAKLEGQIGEICKKIMDKVDEFKHVMTLVETEKISTKEVPCSTTALREAGEGRKEKDPKAIDEGLSLTIVYLTPFGDDKRLREFRSKLRSRLQHANQKRLRFTEANYREVVLNSVQDLIREQPHADSSLMRNVLNPDAQVILGVIDREGISNAKYHEIAAEMRRFGDRKPGAVTVCADQQELEKLLSSKPDLDDPSLPKNIIRKINFMLGNENYTTERLNEEDSTELPLMIAGAHISHAEPGATEYCPSVAAVVASVDKDAIIYPGSTRLLANHGAALPDTISNLQDMMKERFETWKSKNEDGKPPKGLLFYRGSYDAHNDNAYEDESAQIHAAYKDVFRDEHPDIKLNYIVLTRNFKAHRLQTENTPEKSNGAPFTFTTNKASVSKKLVKDQKARTKRSIELMSSAKYQYHVIRNELGLSSRRLANLTAKLNLTSQYGPKIELSIVPPITYAGLLSRRVLDYFHFWSHKDVVNIPMIARLSRWNERDFKHAGNPFMEVVQNYLEWDSMLELNEKRNEVEKIRKEDQKPLPWKPNLDNTMFYL